MTDTNPSSDLRRMSSNEFLTFGQESKADPCTLYQQYQSLSADKAAPTSKNMDRCEGLPCFSGAHLAEKNTETDLPWQFGPGRPCDVDSQYILREEFSVSGLGDIANPKNSKKFSETEYEWQLIIDRKQTFESEWFSLNILEDNDLRNESVDTLNKEDGFGAETNLSSKSSLFSGSETVESSDAGTSKSSKLSGSLSTEINAAKSSHRDGALWRTADSKELAALVSEKKHRYLKNCDLPSSENSSWKGPLSGCDLIPSKDTRPLASSADNVLLASLHKEDPNQLESRRLPSSPLTAGSAGLMQSHGRSPIMSEPQAIPSSLPVHAEKRSGDIKLSRKVHSRGHVRDSKCGFEALGEALCHSQTRARQAEKLATQALQEREKLVQLIFRESWTARTYKQWVHTLELENMCLKMWPDNDLEAWIGNEKELSGISNSSDKIVDPFRDTLKCLPQKKHCSLPRPREGRSKKHGSVPENKVWLRCTIGLAFALGLSFAGAGLMIGWSMGWILLPH